MLKYQKQKEARSMACRKQQIKLKQKGNNQFKARTITPSIIDGFLQQ